MENFRNKDGGGIVLDLHEAIKANKQYLSDIDGAIGDGDHGVNMYKGFHLCAETLKTDSDDLSYNLMLLANTLLEKIGGSMGPLYGMFFLAMSDACEDAEEIDSHIFKTMLQDSVRAIQEISEAKPGDKTLMDVLVPAEEAYSAAVNSGASFTNALQQMVTAAIAGRDSTIDMVSKIGRSSRLGERSRGVMDAGAASCCLILETMAASINRMLE